MESGVTAAWVRLGLELAAQALLRGGIFGTGETLPGRAVRSAAGGGAGVDGQMTLEGEMEDYYIEQLAERGIDTVFLSASAGRLKEEPRCAPEVEHDRPVYFVSAPFDSSLLNKPGLQSVAVSALAIYTRPVRPELADSLASVVVNIPERSVTFSGARSAFEGRLDHAGKLVDWRTISPNGAEKLAEAQLEVYLMKPVRHFPAVEKLKLQFRGVKFLLPNSGPAGFCDVAAGKADACLAFGQRCTEIFPGLAVAERAGCVATTFEGQRVAFGEDPSRRINVACSANGKLHTRLLDALKAGALTDSTGLEDD
ncbi:hypothetical protein LLH00_18595 [bacterium]|nr:hypothetical protein [bacterium]